MKKSFKKAIAVILTVLMVLTSVPFTALAAPGDYEPNITLRFGTASNIMYSGLYAGEGAYDNSTSKNTDALDSLPMAGLYGVPLDYDIKTGELKLTAAKTQGFATFYEMDAATEDYVYTTGDYFMVTVLLENVSRLATEQIAITYSDNIEPAGVYGYGTPTKRYYAFRGISDLDGNEKAEAQTAGTVVSGQCSDAFYGTINEIAGDLTEWHDSRIDPDDAKLVKSGGKNYVMTVSASSEGSVGTDVSSVTSDADAPFFDPTTGAAGYNFENTAILETFMFKVTGDGPINFDLLDKDATIWPTYDGAYYIANTTDGILNSQYTTYAINTTDSVDGSENPGSAKMTFFGTNENKTSSECTHSLQKTAAVAATCTTNGNIEYYTCANCGKLFSDAAGANEITAADTVVSATGHSLTKTDAVDATCAVAGNIEYYTCSVCGKLFSDAAGANEITAADTVVSATGHSLTKTDAVDATCAVAGNIEYYTCSVCGKLFSDAAGANEITAADTVVPATGAHSYGAWVSDGKGNHSKTCSVCNDVVTEACSDFSYSIVEAPTYDKEGTGRYTCNDCGYYYDVTIPVETCSHANTTIINAVDATCTKEGYTGDTYCNDCGKTIATGTTIEKAAHTLTKTDAVAPTCTTDGNIEYYTCSVCNKIFSDAAGANEITAAQTVDPATGHSLTKTDAVAAKCEEDGNIEYYTCSVCNKIFSDAAGANEITAADTVLPATGHTEGDPVVVTIPATVDAEGSITTTVSCTVCGAELDKDVQVLPIIPSYTVTVEATDMGQTTINGVDSTDGASVKIAKEGGKVTLTATPVGGAEFVGWIANGETLVSTEKTFSPAVLANVTYTPVFAINNTSFTVTFVDAYGNVVSTQTVTSGADIVVPEGPARAGYTFTGWSLTDEEIAALSAATTVTAQYEKNVVVAYTVTADGCTITVNGKSSIGSATDIAYDTRVTVTADGAAAWEINGVIAAYGETYSFYVGADVTVVPVFDAAIATAPTVANVKVEEYGTTGAIQARFLATRSMEGFKCVDFGFVYGKNDLGEVTLDDVDGTNVKAVYCKTNANQFSLTYGLRAQTGTVTSRAFVAYVDGNGDTQVVYAAPMTYTYA
ncbi:MAG: InlB B-repeat-containing protein [Eubacterium sp.]